MNGATILVKAQNYLDNYSIKPTIAYNGTTIEHTSTIDYAGTIDQNIYDQIVYQKLVISGSGVKRLIGPTTVSSGATDTQVNVNSATLDLGAHQLVRQATGGSLTVAAGATLKIGGPANTPVNFTSRTFSPASTVEYYGGAQTVQHNTYGHLTFSTTGSSPVAKTMPAEAMTIAGNLTSTANTTYTASNALTIGGHVTIGAGSTFNGGTSLTHTVAGNWVNNGAFVPGSSTVAFNGAVNTTITGETTFSGLTINKTAAINYVALNSNVTTTNLSLTNGDLHTGANKVTLLGNRTGNGWVVGTLTRLHTFASGTSYAFNGPLATLSFAGASGINEVTMRTGAAGFQPTGFVNGKSINRLYEIQMPSGSFSSASLQLQYKDAELNGCEEDGLKLYYSPTGAGTWSNASRHAYDATQNWVRRNNLATINGFWTLTDNPSTYKWDGGANTIAWSDGANWEVWTDGAPTRGITGPISSDFVELGGLVPQTQPTISAAEWVRDIKFFGANQMQLTIASGSLRTNYNLVATGSGAGVQHQLNAGAQQVTIGGNLILNDGSTGNSLSFGSGAGTTIVTGNIEQRGTGSISLASGNLNIGGNYTYEAGSFTAGTSTVTYNGSGTQEMGAVPYHHLTINKTAGTANYTATTAPGISGNLTIANTGGLNLQVPLLQVAGHVSILAGSLQGNASTIDLKGNWLTAGTTSFVPGSSTVVFSGSSAQLVAATSFNNLQKTTANTLTTTGSSTLTGNLTIDAGTLVLNGHTMNRNGAGGQLSLADNATLQINGTAVFPAGFGTNTLALNSNTIYEGGSAGIAGVTYGNLTLQGAGTRALLADARVANQMYIAGNTTLNDAAATLTLDRNLTTDGIINAPNTNLLFTNTAANLNGSGIGGTSINNLTIATGSGLSASKDLILYGNLTNNGNNFSAPANQVTFTGTVAATVTSSSTLLMNQLRITKAAPATAVTLSADISGLQTIDVLTGTLNAANRTLTEKATGTSVLTIADAATMRVAGTSTLPTFDNYSLAPASFAVYEGSNQLVKSIQYGNLHLQNIGTATFEAGTARVAGNLVKGTEATVVTPLTIEYNGAGAQLVAALNYNNLTLSSTGAKTFATGETRIAEAFTRTGTMPVDARTNATTINYTKAGNQQVLPLNYNNLTLSGSGTKAFAGISAVNGAFTLAGAATADLTTAENTIIFDGATQTVPALNYKNLSVTAAGIKTLAGTIEVEKALTLTAGELLTGAANKVILHGATGSLSETGNTQGYLKGTIETERTLTANTTETFNGLGISITPTAGAPGLTKVTRVTGTTVGTSGTSILRNYKVEPQGENQNLNATVSLQYYSHELNGLTETDLAIYSSSNLSNTTDNWKLETTTNEPDVTGKIVTLNGAQKLARFTLGSRLIPLPVELVYFRVWKDGLNAVLEWKTASEKNNAGFEVQVSADGKTYQKLGFVESKTGTSAIVQNYSFTDNRNGKLGVLHYRIKQTDHDGTSKLYAPRAIDFGQVTATTFMAYPNPFVKDVQIGVKAEQSGKATIALYTAAGKAVLQQEQEVAQGASVLQLVLNQNLPRGLYLLTVTLGNHKQTLKLIKE
ncbi:T9SS type A sorting domain-containing protein [Pontibacter sp. Tf4]|uniref:T9SS type A sorting domain-containing protein n=1 Tax=Pontibacter sp. Tf4 TaxID=2761620 RepID=UPI001624D431|nr:T9SS type A sorting domain-containing protein [Pontibacter sp. Tf4]MBB6609466.1 T9SS type A sorting domain-containing protein [Pontibacter sp. Tf4]